MQINSVLRSARDINFLRKCMAETDKRKLSEDAKLARMEHMAESEGALSKLAFERVLGQSDLFDLNYLERGLMAARPVCRIAVYDGFGAPGYGTGFLISPRLMMTNHHVLSTADQASQAVCDFRYEVDQTRRPRPVSRFRLRPDEAFHAEADMDFALVAVDPISETGDTLDDFGFLRLSAKGTKVTVGEYVSIIQHPNGEFKKVAMRENEVVQYGGAEGLENFMWYVCDTAPGSSGSPVFNDSWQVAALHHAGVPDTRTRGGKEQVRTRSAGWIDVAQITQRGLGDDIVWIANEGVRISRILKRLTENEAAHRQPEIRALLEDATGRTSFPGVQPGVAVVGPALGITGENGPPPSRPTVTRAPVTPVRGPSDMGEMPRLQINCRQRTLAFYEGRKGYDSTFLGGDIPLPRLTPRALELGEVAPVKGADDGVLRYQHYSVVMNADRRLAFFAAVNIDGARSRKIKRSPGRDIWCFDPRVDRAHQVGNDLYKSERWVDEDGKNRIDWFSRGHLVRREDPVWGGPSEAQTAESDTFNWTNCAPQYVKLNQEWWLGLETYVLNNLDADDLRANIYNGPVFTHADNLHRGFQLPNYYWKVVAALDKAGKLVASAFILDQSEFNENIPFEEVPVGNFGGYQTTIRKLETRTGLDFGDAIRAADVRAGREDADVEVSSLADLDVPRPRTSRG